VERITLTEEIGRLRDAYVREGVLGRASRNDAEHIAGFEAVNLLHGYRPIRIYSPREVVD